MSKAIDWPIFPELARAIDRRLDEERLDKTKLPEERITASKLADDVGIGIATMSNIRNGKQSSSAHVPRICKILGIDMWAYFPFDAGQRRLLAALEKLRNADVPSDEESDFLRLVDVAASGLAAEFIAKKHR